MVLFLFVVMMLDINVERVQGGYTRYAPLGVVIAGLMVVELIQVIWMRGRGRAFEGFSPNPEGYSNTKALGSVLYTEHVYAFEIAAVILLLAIVAAITLTMRRRPGLKQQNIASQVAVKAKDRVRIVNMASEKPE
jgi:NADH-quinone oxidoreductase subunit J